MVPTELLLNATPKQSSAADNALATVTVAAQQAMRHFILGVEADYSAAVALFRTITVKRGTTTLFQWRWDFSKGPFSKNLPVPFHGDYNEAVSVELQASGTGGITGVAGIITAAR